MCATTTRVTDSRPARLRAAVAVGDTISILKHVSVPDLAMSMLRASSQVMGIPEASVARPELLALVKHRLRQSLGLARSDSLVVELPEDLYSEPLEFVGFSGVHFVNDTAVVQRRVHVPMLDTTLDVESGLAPDGAGSWRLVSLPNLSKILAVIVTRRLQRVAVANARGREAFAAAVRSTIAIERVPLKEWGQYALDVRVSLTNVSGRPLRLTGLALHGPTSVFVDDSAWVTIRAEPLTLTSAGTATVARLIPLGSANDGVAAIAETPGAARLAFDTLELGRTSTKETYVQYRSWKEYVRSRLLPTTSGGRELITEAGRVSAPNNVCA